MNLLLTLKGLFVFMKKRNIISVSAVAVICATLLLARGGRTGDTVKITVDGELYCEKKLSESCEIKIGETNTAVIENGEVYMKDADCPDKLCVRQGKISDTSKKIICLPNKVIIEVTKKSDIDMVVR